MNLKTVKAETLNIGDRFRWPSLKGPTTTTPPPWRVVTHKSNRHIIGELVTSAQGLEQERVYSFSDNVSVEDVVGHQPPTDPCVQPPTKPEWRVGQRVLHRNTNLTAEIVFIGKQRVLLRHDDQTEGSYLLDEFGRYFEPAKQKITLPHDTWWAYLLNSTGFRWGSDAYPSKGGAINWLKGRTTREGGIVHIAKDGTVEYFDRHGDPATAA